jgi:molybdate-binding protein/DNA-binding XRE family transcriptional regulator
MAKQNQEIVCRVKSFRQAAGWSQEQLAKRVGIKRQAIYDIESGRYLPNTAVALQLAKQFGCRVEDLFSEPEITGNQPVVMAEGHDSACSRISLTKVRGRFFGYPLNGMHSFGQELRSADGIFEKSGENVRLLCSNEYIENTVLLLGCDPAFSLLRAHVSRIVPKARVNCRFASSYRAMDGLSAGQCHIAGVHLHNTYDKESNVVIASQRLAGIGGVVMGFSLMEEGLMVAPGNPYGIRSAADLAADGLQMVNREPGAALRILLDDKLAQSNLSGSAIKGYDHEVRTHNQSAQMVACRVADAALGLRPVASAFGLDFVPIAEVRCDLVIPSDMLEHPTIRVLLDVLQSEAFRDEISLLPGYNSSKTGSTIAKF